jgi:hypothetical protein
LVKKIVWDLDWQILSAKTLRKRFEDWKHRIKKICLK